MIFDPSMPTSQIQAKVNAIAAQQVDNEMGTQRYSLLFKPGTYGTTANPLSFQVGYYTEVAGLGEEPTDVTINGNVDVYNRCTPTTPGTQRLHRAGQLLALHVQPHHQHHRQLAGAGGCHSNNFWAVSQAAPMRRVNVNGVN